jgi:hypothetical protein
VVTVAKAAAATALMDTMWGTLRNERRRAA